MAKVDPKTGPVSVSAQGGVDTKHPDYIDREDEWRLMRDTTRGGKAVKDAGITYLPMPAGFAKQPDKGVAMYNAYRTRAGFPIIVSPTLTGMIGVMHRKEAQIEMPAAMEPIWERATKDGMTLEALHKQITYELLDTGRYGLLVEAELPDVPNPTGLPYIACYTTESIINWNENYNDFYVLDETALKRNGYAWEEVSQWRVLELEGGQYQQRVIEGANKAEGPAIEPTARGAAGRLKEIPFVVVGPRGLSAVPEDPPLLGVANAAVAIYQLNADYRHQLYMTGQETLFVYNMDPPDAIGAGVVHTVTDVSKDLHMPKAEYVGPQGIGIESHRTAIQDQYEVASKAGARLFEQQERSQESGEARKTRYLAETASLASIALASAAALEKALRYVAVFMGLDPKQVVVKPDLSFLTNVLSPEQAAALVKMWQDNAISYETMYANLLKSEIASSERTWEEEMDLIDEQNESLEPEVTGMVRPTAANAA